MMRYLALIVLLLAFTESASASVPVSKKETIQQLASSLAKAYKAKNLGVLDAKKPYIGQVKIVIEHSLAGDDDKGRLTRTFKTLTKAEQWLRSRTRAGMPARAIRALDKCGKGSCDYNFDGGILHNQLYLSRFTYTFRNGRYYLKTIYLLDGD